jgi:PTH1 family peptidyl-tRNA hydrolase
VVGIGNPGPEYEDTRHNVGFSVLDRVAARRGLQFGKVGREEGFSGRVRAKVAPGSIGGTAFWLVKPLSYVNLTGVVVGAFARKFGAAPDSIFVVVDDLDLPLGRTRVRPSGSSGGHNGLRSLEEALGSSEFPRLRLGIGRPEGGAAADFVLSRFHEEEREIVERVLARAADAVEDWLSGSTVQDLMNRYNGTCD